MSVSGSESAQINFLQNLVQKIYQQGLSFMLMAVYIVYSQVQRASDQKKMEKALYEERAEKNECLDDQRQVLYHLVQESVLSNNKSSEVSEKMLKYLEDKRH